MTQRINNPQCGDCSSNNGQNLNNQIIQFMPMQAIYNVDGFDLSHEHDSFERIVE